jgi:hypothetical protein
MSENTRDFNQTYDAEQMTEEIQNGDRPAPQVDVSADYEASKELSVSEIDQTGEGAKAAEAATAPNLKVPKAEDTTSKAAADDSDPNDYLEMAQDVNPISGNRENVGVNDDLVKKAIKRGEPGQS